MKLSFVILKKKSKSEKNLKLRAATVKYNEYDRCFYVALRKDEGILQINEECLLFNVEPIVDKVYSLPTHTLPEEDYKRRNLNVKGKTDKQLSTISKAWSKIKPGMKVKGIIKDDIFIIKKI
jgi:hypothetical protein